MSAFIVSDSTLQNIVRFLHSDVVFSNSSPFYGALDRTLLKHGFNLKLPEHNDRLIKEMALLNRLGVNERYDERELEADVRYAGGCPPGMIQAYKSLKCFLYQCCEGDIPETNELYKMFDKISDSMAHAIVRNLPEYENGKWDA